MYNLAPTNLYRPHESGHPLHTTGRGHPTKAHHLLAETFYLGKYTVSRDPNPIIRSRLSTHSTKMHRLQFHKKQPRWWKSRIGIFLKIYSLLATSSLPAVLSSDYILAKNGTRLSPQHHRDGSHSNPFWPKTLESPLRIHRYITPRTCSSLYQNYSFPTLPATTNSSSSPSWGNSTRTSRSLPCGNSCAVCISATVHPRSSWRPATRARSCKGHRTDVPGAISPVSSRRGDRGKCFLPLAIAFYFFCSQILVF